MLVFDLSYFLRFVVDAVDLPHLELIYKLKLTAFDIRFLSDKSNPFTANTGNHILRFFKNSSYHYVHTKWQTIFSRSYLKASKNISHGLGPRAIRQRGVGRRRKICAFFAFG
jgi:hypothetical protein